MDTAVKFTAGVLFGYFIRLRFYKKKKSEIRKSIEDLDYYKFKTVIYNIQSMDNFKGTIVYNILKKKFFFDDDILDTTYGEEIFMNKYDPLYFQRKRKEEEEKINKKEILLYINQAVERSVIRQNYDIIGGYSTDEESVELDNIEEDISLSILL